MGQVHVQVVLTNHREEVMARLGQLAPERVHRYETEVLIDTGAVRSTIPSAIADRLGLFRLGHTDAKYADGRVEEVDMTEAISYPFTG
jgi:predicted aspartyl protease